ncbi:MAG: ABC transporter permease [Gemmatimonadaceae bacterium]
MMADLRYAVRALLRSPGFTLAVVVTLALGIGANSAIFSIVYGVLLRPLPYAQPDRLVVLYGRYPNFGRTGTSLPDFRDWRDRSHSFEQLAARHSGAFVLTGEGEPERVLADRVTSNFFTTLGVKPLLGRAFLPEEDRMSGDRQVVVLSHGYWQRRFGGEARVVGRQIQLNGRPWTVVGVAPPEFRFGQAVDMWTPTVVDTVMNRRAEYLDVIGRLKPGVTVEQASADMAAVIRQLAQLYPQTNATITSEVIGLEEDLVKDVRLALYAFVGAVLLVLLIACANVANLLLARAAVREHEVAVRVALGAGRGRLVRQLLTESMVLALLGGVAGIALATWAVAAVGASGAEFLPRQHEIGMNSTVVVFSLLLSAATGLVFGLAPALRLSRGPLNATLRDGARGATGGSLARLRGTLVLGEVALALVLLVGAGLLIRSFEKLTRVDLGFEPSTVLTCNLTFPSAKFPDRTLLPPVYRSLLDRMRSLPGVRTAAISASLPMEGASYVSYTIEGIGPRDTRPDSPPEDVQPFAVSPDYFAALGVPLRRGRLISANDDAKAPRIALVNDEMARFAFAGADPVGHRITFGNPSDTAGWMTIVGVVGNVAQEGVTAKPYQQIYRPIEQAPSRSVYMSLRTDRDPVSLAASARAAVRDIDRDLVVNEVQPLEARVAQSVARPRLSVWLLTSFSALALLLAAIGIYGVMAYTVAQRTREIGVRMALGADPGNVKRLVVRQGMRPALLGVAVGLLVSLAASRFIASLLYGVSALDPLTFVLVPLFLSGVALAATYLPARRASLVSPTAALQSE